MRLNITGNQPIITPRDPVLPMEAANKQYVDAGITNHETDNTLHLTTAQNTFLDAVTASSAEVNYLVGVTSAIQTQINSKVAKAGDTMTGLLTLSGVPTENLHAATKKYVDDGDALKVAKAGDTMTGALTLSGDPTSALHASTKQYVDTKVSTHASDATLHLTSTQNTFLDAVTATSTEVNYLVGVSSAIQTQLNSKVNKAGDTMTGALTLSGAPTLDLHAATKKYADDGLALKVAKAGDTLTGFLTLHADPTNALHAAPKQYVDTKVSTHAGDAALHLTTAQNTFLDAVTVTSTEVNYLSGVTSSVQTQITAKVAKAGDTMTGALTLSGAPTATLHAATKGYVDNGDALKVAKAGDTMTGALTLSGAPISDLHAVTKKYADDGLALKVAKVGDTLTGFLTLHADPTSALHAASKQYVDTKVSTHASDAALHLTTAQNTFLDAVTVTSTEVNYLSGVTSAIQTQINNKFDKAGGTITGDVTLSDGKAIYVSKAPTTANELVNKTYVDSLIQGLRWEEPVTDINLVHDKLSTPPTTPVVNDVYIIGASPTGAWLNKAGYATYYNGTAWVFLQGRAVAVGDRFGVSLTSATTAAGGLAGKDHTLVTIVTATPGAITYSTATIDAGSTTLVFDPQASNFGVTYTYTDEGTWVVTNTSVNIAPGDALTLSGNTLNVNVTGTNGLQITNDAIQVKLDANNGLGFAAGGGVYVVRDGTTLSVSASGIKVSDTVINNIADRISKTGTTSVTGSVSFTATASLKTAFTPSATDDVTNKTYVDTKDTALQTQITNINTTVTTLNTDPVTKTYVNNQDALKVAKAGDTMTGALTLSGAPTADLHAATKKYADDGLVLKVAKAGDTLTGFLTLHADPTNALHAAPKQYVDTKVSTHANDATVHLTSTQNTFLDAVTVTAAEVNYLSGVTSAIQTQISSKVAKAGDTMTGALTLSGAPTNDLHAATKVYVDNGDALKVAKAGDTMTGALTLSGDPTSILHAATKQYVDTNISTHATNTDLHVTAAQSTLLDALTATATELNYTSGVTSAIQTQLNGKVAKAGDTMTGALTLSGAPTLDLHAATKKYADDGLALKVNKAGDTLTGFLTLHAAPTSDLHASTKKYVDDKVGTHASDNALHLTTTQNTFLDAVTVTAAEVNYLSGVTSSIQTQITAKVAKAGDTMTGALTLSGAPTANLHAATKGYVDTADALKVAKAGDTMTGALTLSGAPTLDLHAATKRYVDDSATNSKTYIDNQDALKVAKAGDVMTGFLTLHAAPTSDLHASTKRYVDDSAATTKTYVDAADLVLQNQINTIKSTTDTLNADPVTKTYVNTGLALKVSKAGDAMTGYLVLHADPSQAMHAATKQYVDTLAQGLSVKTAVRLATTGNLSATYANGTAGVNATLTGTANGVLTVDGKAVNVGDRILVGKQTAKLQNGGYTVQQVGSSTTPFILKRIESADQSAEIPTSFYFVSDGDTLEGTGWVLTVADPLTFTIGTNDINVNQFSGQGNIIAGNGLTLTGNTLAVVTANTGRIVVNPDSIDLATTGVTAGSFTKVTVDAYGRVTGGSNPTTLAGYGISDGQPLNANLTSLSSVATAGILVRDSTNAIVAKSVTVSGTGLSVTNGSGGAAGNIQISSNATNANTASTIVARDASGNFTAGTITAALTGNASTATTLQTARNFSLTGDVTATAVSFNGSANVALTTTLANSGATAGTYTKVTVNAKGLVTSASNPTTVAGYGITDVYTKTQVDTMLADLRKEIAELQLYILSRV